MSKQEATSGAIRAFRLLIFGGVAIGFVIALVNSSKETPQPSTRPIEAEALRSPRQHPGLQTVYTARWLMGSGAGVTTEWIDVLVKGKREVASRRCQQLVGWHGLDEVGSGGRLVRFCEPGAEPWPPAELGLAERGWLLKRDLETDPVELSLRQFEPQDSDFHKEYKLLMGVVATRYNTVNDPMAGERWLLGAQVTRYRFFADEAACRAAIKAIPFPQLFVAEQDLSRLEQALADQRARVSVACPMERGEGDSLVRCEISRRTLAVLDEHLEKIRRGRVAVRRATCRELGN